MSPSSHTNAVHAPAASNPMGKIVALVGVAIIVFLAFTSFSVQKAVQSNTKLADIRDLYFPVLERVDANIVRLDKMEDRFMQGVMTGERDTVEQSQQYYAQGDQVFAEMIALYPARRAELVQLRSEFKAYRDLAYKTSMGMIAHTGSFSDIGRMNAQLNDLKSKLKDFRQSSYNNFVSSLQQTQAATQLNLYMGMAMGVMNLLFMGVLVFFIRNNLRMTAVIAEQNATLEIKVEQRTAELSQKTNDINAMLNNMSLGVCTVVHGNVLHPEYSAYMHSIFGEADLAGRDVIESLFAHSDLGADTRDQVAVALSAIIGEDMMMFDFNSHLLVSEMRVHEPDGQDKILQLHWSPIKNDQDAVDKVLLIAQDVTHLRALELESASQKEELDIISQIIKISIGKFNEFIESAQAYVAENDKLIRAQKTVDTETVAALFRNMHTIKGNARTFEFKLITDAAHLAEQSYDYLRKDPDASWDQVQLLAELQAVVDAIAHYRVVSEDKLGRKGRASDMLTARGAFVSVEEILSLKSALASVQREVGGEALKAVQAQVAQLGLVPLQRLASGAVDSISSLAKELGKPTPHFEIIHGEVAFNNAVAQALKSSLMHIVRNCLDHGIELPQERQQAGKSVEGHLRFDLRRQDDGVQLRISDDGRGLALHKLYAKGVESGVFAAGSQPSPAEVAELIFRSGLSTAEQLSQVSGRGVGMDAVRTFIEEQGGRVSIELHEPHGLDFCPFAFLIELPAAALSMS